MATPGAELAGNTARALTNATLALVGERGRPPEADLRKALTSCTFNVRASVGNKPPDDIARSLAWLERNTRTVGELEKPAIARTVLDALALTAAGSIAAPASVQRQRGVVVNAAEYAVERRLLVQNPITNLTWKAPRTVQSVDRRVVVSPEQARTLLDAVALEKPSGDRLVAFFGAMYYAALRPGEASTLRKSNLALPTEGWGELLLEASTPEAGASWTDNGRRRHGDVRNGS